MAEDQDAMKALKHITKGSYNIQAQNKSYDRHKPLLAKIMTLSSEELSSSPGLVLLAFFRIFNKFNLLPHHTFVRKFEKALLYKLDTEVSGKVRKQMLMEFSHLRWRSPLRHSPYFLREYRSYILENFKDFDLSLKLQVLQAETVADNPFLPSQLSELFEHVSSDLGYDDRYHAVSLDQLNGMYRAVLFLSAKNRNNSLLAPLKRLKENLIESALKNFSSDITKSETDESESKKRVRHYQRSEKRMLKEFKKISRGEVSIEFISSDLGVYDPVDFFIHNQKLVVEVDGSQHFFRFIDLEGNHIQNSSEPMRNIDRARGFIFRQNGIQLIRHNPMKESFNSLMSRVRSKIR
jgi:very-short-patch-repair endonuclease